MKRKILLILVSLLTPFAGVIASDLSEYERHYEELNRLRGQLERLELEKKIQQLKADIKNVRTGAAGVSANAASAGGLSAPVTVDPNTNLSKLIYIVGTGSNARAVIDFRGNKRAVKNGDLVDGWRVKIEERKVVLSKGNDMVEL